jgi:hypothetical protein
VSLKTSASAVAGRHARATTQDADLWGENDSFFTPEGGRAYLPDLPEAELNLLHSGHFAVEGSLEEITSGRATRSSRWAETSVSARAATVRRANGATWTGSAET